MHLPQIRWQFSNLSRLYLVFDHSSLWLNPRSAQGGLQEESKAKAAHGDALSASEAERAKLSEQLAALQVGEQLAALQVGGLQ